MAERVHDVVSSMGNSGKRVRIGDRADPISLSSGLAMELGHLRYFVATVERKSLREASRRIHVAQPAISQTISNLEAELGVRLLARSGGRSVKPTSEGQLFYQEFLKTRTG